ncbi:hypothetical protein KC332_g15674, partial [Hortaea werneckii]
QQQQQQPPPAGDGQNDPYAAWGGQANLMAWYAQQMANMQQGGQGAPGTQ